MKVVAKNHEEWLALRNEGIGASEVGTIMLCNPWQTKYQLWRRKKGLDENVENDAMLWGHLLEESCAQLFAIKTGAEIVKSSAKEIMYIHDKKPFMRISPDRLYYEQGAKKTKNNLRLLECKTTEKPIDPNAIPRQYMCQCQYQMHVTGIHVCTLAWMVLSTRSFDYKTITYDPLFCNAMEKYVEKFWNENIVANVEPPVENSEDAKMKWPKAIVGSKLDATEEDIVIVNELAEVKAQIKAYESDCEYVSLVAREKELTEKLKVRMADNENMVFGDNLLLTYKSGKDKQIFDEKKAIEMHPELAELYSTKPGNRTMLIKVKA